jgi:CubicO group peptidase (beta-lactamase class C family)
MRVLAALVSVVVLGSAAMPSMAAGPWSEAKSQRVDSIVSRFLASREPGQQPPGLSIGVGVGGELVVAKGWGEAQPGAAADADTLYQVGSLTKQFTAAGVLKIIERDSGAAMSSAPLTLDRPLRQLFDGVASWELPGAPPITVRSLLTMTSNLPNFTAEPPPESDPWGAMPASRLLGEVKKLAPNGWPNSFAYSNTSYFLLSEIIEMRAGGQMPPGGVSQYREFLRSELFQPAGMTRTGFASELESEVATPHYRRHSPFGKPDWFKGSGDVVSNVRDLFAWDKALMERRVVSPRIRDLMFAPSAPITPALTYGMGFYVERAPGLDIYSHSGTVPGYTAFNAILVEKGKPGWIGVTILTNSDGIEDLQRLADALAVVALE